MDTHIIQNMIAWVVELESLNSLFDADDLRDDPGFVFKIKYLEVINVVIKKIFVLYSLIQWYLTFFV